MLDFRDDSPKGNDNFKGSSWESGIKFIEKKKRRKVCRGVITLAVAICSAIAGGVIGGSCVRDGLFRQAPARGQQGLNLSMYSDTIHQVAESSGPAVVGVLTTSPDNGCSGIIFDPKGYIITSYEAIKNIPNLLVVLPDKPQEPIAASLIGADLKAGIAILKIDIQNLTSIALQEVSKPGVGDMVLSIANPTGEEYSGAVSAGYITSAGRKMDIDDESYSIVETSSIVTTGSTGGALFSIDGSVIGINMLCAKDYTRGYSLCLNQLTKIIDGIMSGDNESRPYIGIEHCFMDSQVARAYGMPKGERITGVRSESSAEKAGLQRDDVITGIGGKAIDDSNDLRNAILQSSPGDILSFEVWRDGQPVDITAVVESSLI